MRKITKVNNVYYQARIKAAEHNERLKSMEGAADALGVSYSTLAAYELGTVKCPAQDKVILMAELYNAPELLNYYCANECMIGDCRQMPSKMEVEDFHKIALKTLAKLRRVGQIKEDLLEIAEDGEITRDEESILEEILMDLDGISEVAQELKVWAKKRLRKE